MAIVSRTTKALVWFSVGVIQKTELYSRNTKEKWKYSVMPQGIHILNTAHNQDVSPTTGSETKRDSLKSKKKGQGNMHKS